ncbi:hypothetical protein BX666DRAFT_1886109 [Dichotomocladium elegans]|nr:hypothetical protein BX666DRAFT_1886109 [Dichotomocladium elegans]
MRLDSYYFSRRSEKSRNSVLHGGSGGGIRRHTPSRLFTRTVGYVDCHVFHHFNICH